MAPILRRATEAPGSTNRDEVGIGLTPSVRVAVRTSAAGMDGSTSWRRCTPVLTVGAGEGTGERWGMSVSIEWGGVPLEALGVWKGRWLDQWNSRWYYS